MAIGSFARSALVDLSPEDVTRMLALDETLFVEHKTGIGQDFAHGLMSAVSSFANGLGGWILLGVADGLPVDDPPDWLTGGAPTLVDVVRDRLRHEIDPLPAFEARVIDCPGTNRRVGVVRVYESSDTPHISLRTGAVYVREVAGSKNAADPGRPGPGRHGERIYRARQIGSRAQLLELARRGRDAEVRVKQLVDPASPLPLVSNALPLDLGSIREGGYLPTSQAGPAIIVRLCPYTLSPRFRNWATTADAAAALLGAAEVLSNKHGLGNDWSGPDPSGAHVAVPLDDGLHWDAGGVPLSATACLVADGAGVVGAALSLAAPENEGRRSWIRLEALSKLISRVITAAADVLKTGEFLGRVHCQVDLQKIPKVFLLEDGGNRPGGQWIPSSDDLVVPADTQEVVEIALRSANALGRSAGIRAWNRPGVDN